MAPWDFSNAYIPVAAASFVFFVTLSKVISPYVSSALSLSYRDLSPAGKVDWNSRVSSSVHAITVSSLCVYILMFDSPIFQDKIWGDSPYVKANCAIVVGYMTADFVLMLIYYKYIGEVFYIFHHLATILPYLIVMVYGVFSYFANFRLIAEFSTPFINNSRYRITTKSTMGVWVVNPSCFPVAAASFIFFAILSRVISPHVSSALSISYRNLPPARKVDWDSRISSSVHALIVISLCVYCLLFDYPIYEDKIWGHSVFVKSGCAIVVGYMFADLVVMLVYYSYIGDVFYIFHHLASIIPYTIVMIFGVFNYFANFRLMAEFSTPFINNRWFFDILGYPRSSVAYVSNGLTMSVVFFLARIISMPFYYYQTFQNYGTDSYKEVGWLYYTCIIIYPCIVLDIINMFWFYKLALGCKKVIKGLVNKDSLKLETKKE